jgi:DNA polymerase III gamma/tau subunit
MDKYLKQLLETYAKVILPSFGAIVVENEETGNLMFNGYLSYNDGKLDDLIVSESNMELQEAQNTIAKYIREIQVQIDKGESYDIFELGRFYKNEDGEIEFEGNLKDGPKAVSKSSSDKAVVTDKSGDKSKKEEAPKKEAPKAKEEKKESKPEPKKEESKKESKVDSKAKKDTKSDSKSTQKENKFVAKKEKDEANANKAKLKADAIKKKDEANANKAKLKADAIKKKEEAKANKAKLKADANKKKEEAKANKAKLKADAKANKAKASDSPKTEKVKNEKTPKDPKKKKRFGAFFWIVIVILALVSAGLIYVGLNYEQVKTYMGWNKFENEEKVAPKESQEDTKEAKEQQEDIEFNADGNPASDTIETSDVEFDEEGNVAEEKQEIEEKPAPAPEPSTMTTSSTGTHHLIAGSFSNKSNAEGLVLDLKSKGLNARILGVFGGLHFVAAESYNSSKEAKADISRVRQQASGVWIYRYNDK